MRQINRLQFLRFLFLCLLSNSSLAGSIVSECTEAALRDAMAGGGSVSFACDGTIVLTNTLVITNETSFDATGRSIVLSGGGARQILIVESGALLRLHLLSLIDGLSAGTNGVENTEGGPAKGGAVRLNGGSLIATDCTFRNNTAHGGTGGDSPGLNPGAAGGAGLGGAIFNMGGQIHLTNCTLIGNLAWGGLEGSGGTAVWYVTGGDSAGGAIFSTQGQVQLVDCMVGTNVSLAGQGRRSGTIRFSGKASGGALYQEGGTLELVRSTFSGNGSRVEYLTSVASGGAITQTNCTSSISDTLFLANWVEGGVGLVFGTPQGWPGGKAIGGALSVSTGSVGVTNSTFAFNKTIGGLQYARNYPGAGSGGAIYSSATTNSSFVNCTIAENIAQAGDNGGTGEQGGAFGGGLYSEKETSLLINVTFSHNAAIPSLALDFPGALPAVCLGGNIYNTNGTTKVLNTILANSPSGTNSVGNLTDLGHNLSSDDSCNFGGSGSLNAIDPKLSALNNFGGATPTLALLVGSPAIDGGDSASFPATDQRGHVRPFGSAADMGAFESSPPYVIRGKISGATLMDEVLVTSDINSSPSTNRGFYSLEGLIPNVYSVSPQSSNYLFMPGTRSISVGPDQIDVDFKAYHWNALSIEGVTNSMLHIISAITNGQTIQIQTSINLSDWSSTSTNTVGPTNYLELWLPIGSEPTRFYRTANPSL